MEYRTSQVAKIIGVHPNTIRFYEHEGLLPEIPREENGYRVYNEQHLVQLRFLRVAFRTEIISNSLRQKAVDIIKCAAEGRKEDALSMTKNYYEAIEEEEKKAEEAIMIASNFVSEENLPREDNDQLIGRKEMAEKLGITKDVLRDWERNGLIQVPKNEKGSRQYGLTEIRRLKLISILRNAHYSMMSILRMLGQLEDGEENMRKAIDTPSEDEDIVCAADSYLTALGKAKNDALEMMTILSDSISREK